MLRLLAVMLAVVTSSAIAREKTGGPAWIRTKDQGIMSPLL